MPGTYTMTNDYTVTDAAPADPNHSENRMPIRLVAMERLFEGPAEPRQKRTRSEAAAPCQDEPVLDCLALEPADQ